jgi:hypothetical protein
MSYSPVDIRLIDAAMSAMASRDEGWTSLRRSPAQLLATHSSLPEVWVDAQDEIVGVTCYPIQPAPEDRLWELAEFMNLVAAMGILVAFALDVPRGVVSLRIHRDFEETIGDPKLHINQLVTAVLGAALLYAPSLSRIAFEGAAPPTELEQIKRLEAQWDLDAEDS